MLCHHEVFARDASTPKDARRHLPEGRRRPGGGVDGVPGSRGPAEARRELTVEAAA
jgi:hypothetical protein